MSHDNSDDPKKPINQQEEDDESGRGGHASGRSSAIDPRNLRTQIVPPRDEDEDESGSGTKSGSLDFKDFLGSDQYSRDDLLSSEDIKRLLSAHQDMNAANVQKQKEKKDQYKALKEGKVGLDQFRREAHGAQSSYQAHPALADKAQFSGTDSQVQVLPSEHTAETNEADANRLDNEYQLRYSLQNTPKFNPKPQYR